MIFKTNKKFKKNKIAKISLKKFLKSKILDFDFGSTSATDSFSAANSFSESNSKLDFQIICLTGKMASGKNFVTQKIIENSGGKFVSIDSDKNVHEAISLCTEKIFEAFENDAKKNGINLKNADGTLNRKALGKLIFPWPELLLRQEKIVYPKTIELTKQFIEENRAKGKSVIINATVLYKIPELMSLCSKIIFVTAPVLTRLLRAKKRDNLPAKQILARFKSQKNLLEEYKKTGIEIFIVKNG